MHVLKELFCMQRMHAEQLFKDMHMLKFVPQPNTDMSGVMNQ